MSVGAIWGLFHCFNFKSSLNLDDFMQVAKKPQVQQKKENHKFSFFWFQTGRPHKQSHEILGKLNWTLLEGI